MATKKNSGADLSAIGEIADTAVINVHHPVTDEVLADDDGNPFWVEVYGEDSAHYKEIDNEINNRNIKANQRSGRGGMSITAHQANAQVFERIYRNVRSWYIILQGEQPECTERNAKDVLTKYPWLRDQIDAAIHDRTNFLNS